jgi:hypothetical protein
MEQGGKDRTAGEQSNDVADKKQEQGGRSKEARSRVNGAGALHQIISTNLNIQSASAH